MKPNRLIRNSFFVLTLFISIMFSLFIASAIDSATPNQHTFSMVLPVLIIGSIITSFGMAHQKSGILMMGMPARYQTGYGGMQPPRVTGANGSSPLSSAPGCMPAAPPDCNSQPFSKPLNVMPAQWDHYFSDMRSFQSANVYPYPDSITVIVDSINAGGGGPGANVDVFLFNQDELNDVTDNGTGANSVQYTYQDNARGKVISRIITGARAGLGLICYGIAIRMQITSSGNGDASGVAATNPRFGVDNGMGDFIPLNFNTTSNQTRKDEDTSLIVIPCIQNITSVTQLKLRMKYLDTATVTVYFTPDYTI